MPKTRSTQTTKVEVQRRIKGLPIDQQRSMLCALVGHSRIHSFCFGYHHCQRCGAMLGDSLAGAYSDSSAVYPIHLQRAEPINGCHCAENVKTLTWRDTWLTPDWPVKP